MTDDTLTLALHGEVSLSAFSEAVARWRGVVESLTREVSPEHSIVWVISDLAAGSATVTARAVGDSLAVLPVARAYEAVGRALATGNTEMLSSKVRDDAAGLVALIHGALDYMRFETAESDVLISAKTDRLVGSPTEVPRPPISYGGIQGRIQTLTSRGGLRFTLYDAFHDRVVGCYLREGQEEIMRDLWGQMAVVEGLVSRDAETGRPLAIRHVRNVTPLRVVDPDSYLAARGAISPALSDERTPEALIRAARDD